LSHVDDASNRDERFARNRLRQRVWPVLVRAFADAEPALAQAAARAQEAAVCLQALAQLDASSAVAGNELDRAAWLRLSGPRRANLLRHWLPAHPLPESLVRRLLDELPAAGASQWPAPGGRLHLHRGRLRWVPCRAEAATAHAPLVLDLGRPGRYELPSGQGCLTVRRVSHGGVAADRLGGASVLPRAGGEQFQIGAKGVPRSLKKQYQLRGVPAWGRGGPLVWAADGALVYVPGLGVDARAQAPEGTRQVTLAWTPAGGD
jgi:tRNA(Ile)-lysidine synthase